MANTNSVLHIHDDDEACLVWALEGGEFCIEIGRTEIYMPDTKVLRRALDRIDAIQQSNMRNKIREDN